MTERELFWKWAQDENPKLVEEAETGCQFAKDILDYMFMGWAASANREGCKLVPVDKLNRIISDTTDIDTYEDLKAMIGAVE